MRRRMGRRRERSSRQGSLTRTGSSRRMRLMNDLRVAAAQFEARDRDKAFNLSRIRELSRKAVEQGAQIVSFHECSITGYTFLQTLSPQQLAEIAEPVPDGPSTRTLINISKELK